jgi:hypothetical protein
MHQIQHKDELLVLIAPPPLIHGLTREMLLPTKRLPDLSYLQQLDLLISVQMFQHHYISPTQIPICGHCSKIKHLILANIKFKNHLGHKGEVWYMHFDV